MFLCLLLLVNDRTGVWEGCARTLSAELCRSERAMSVALNGLESKGYILRDYKLGKQGRYPLIVGEFSISRGPHRGKRIDLVATRKKYDIPEDVGHLGWTARRSLGRSITLACKAPVYRINTARDEDESSENSMPSSSDEPISEFEPAPSSAKEAANFAEITRRGRKEKQGREGLRTPCQPVNVLLLGQTGVPYLPLSRMIPAQAPNRLHHLQSALTRRSGWPQRGWHLNLNSLVSCSSVSRHALKTSTPKRPSRSGPPFSDG